MKGYNLNGTLYIFDATPATIPGDAGDEADLIYVQQELVEAFKSENPDNSAKIKPYNYKLMAVNKLPWADYINENILKAPEIGTVYDFTGYLTEEAIEASSTGQITYEGEYSEDTNYVYGDAEVTFAGSDTPQQLTVYMTKDDFLTTLDGGRAQVFTLQDNIMTSIGYGELSEQVQP